MTAAVFSAQRDQNANAVYVYQYEYLVTLTDADLAAIAAAFWTSPEAIEAHAKLDAILARLTC